MTLPKQRILHPRQIKKFGWKPDLPSVEDIRYKLKLANPAELPKVVDLSKTFSQIPILNQGNLGSCTANAIAVCHMAAQIKAGKATPVLPSRLFIYYNERVIENSVREDSGAQIRDGIKSLAKLGVCPEVEWPYLISKFRTKPSLICYRDAITEEIIIYERLDNRDINQLMEVLSEGLPFVFGFSVYESFESATMEATGIYTPDPKREPIIGGHAVAGWGYDQSAKLVTVRNSWGGTWGLNGYFKMRFSDITNPDMCDDFWVIRTVK